jgi:DNA polymerase III alpha subunit
MPDFSHLHVHTQFSLLDGAADISRLFKKAKADGMKAMAITDHGNMFGVFKFVAEAGKHGVKPIVGCEFYVVNDRHIKQFTKENRDIRHHQLLLAKNAQGYKNLVKLCSLGYIEGLYSKWPRIDKELILQYHEGLIATTCCLGASVPQTILKKGEEEGEIEFKWWLDLFGEDFYIELQRHDIPEQETVNAVLLKFAKKYNVKVMSSNDSHYVDQQDANAHDILLCVNTGDMKSTPIATDEEGGKGYRFGFPNDQFFFKSQAEMGQVFHDLPESLDNTNEIVDKVDLYNPFSNPFFNLCLRIFNAYNDEGKNNIFFYLIGCNFYFYIIAEANLNNSFNLLTFDDIIVKLKNYFIYDYFFYNLLDLWFPEQEEEETQSFMNMNIDDDNNNLYKFSQNGGALTLDDANRIKELFTNFKSDPSILSLIESNQTIYNN